MFYYDENDELQGSEYYTVKQSWMIFGGLIVLINSIPLFL